MHPDPHNQHTETSHDAWESIVSEWVDGESEIRPEDLDTPYGRNVWNTYHLIGDTLRSEELAFKTSDMFYARVSRAIDEEPPIKAYKPLKAGTWGGRVAGLAVAAAAFGALWLSVPYFTDVSNGVAPAVEIASAENTTNSTDSTLHEYFDAHVAMAGGVPALQAHYTGALP